MSFGFAYDSFMPIYFLLLLIACGLKNGKLTCMKWWERNGNHQKPVLNHRQRSHLSIKWKWISINSREFVAPVSIFLLFLFHDCHPWSESWNCQKNQMLYYSCYQSRTTLPPVQYVNHWIDKFCKREFIHMIVNRYEKMGNLNLNPTVPRIELRIFIGRSKVI